MLRKRRTWSDADKEDLIRKAGSYPGSYQELLDTMRVSGSWFRDMRKKFLKAHPEIDFTVPVEKRASGWPAGPTPAPGSFASLPDSEKTVLLKEYLALPVDAKLSWRKRHNVTIAMTAYWRNRLINRVPREAPRENAAALDPAVASALAAYRSLPLREKAPWREAHRLSNAQLFQISRGVATPNIAARVLSPANGNRQLTVRDQRLSRIPDPISMIPDSAPQIASVPVSLDDAILAFEVKLDHMREFTEQLKRMRSGR